MRLIDADELRDEFDCYDFSEYSDYSNVIDMIDDAPTIEAEPVRHGRWVADMAGYSRCSECRELVDNMIATFGGNFCPNCGAKMDGGVSNA